MFISFFGKYPDNLDPYSAALGDQGDFTEEPERIEDIAGEAQALLNQMIHDWAAGAIHRDQLEAAA